VVDGPATPPIGGAGCPPLYAAVPAFVSQMTEAGRLPESTRSLSLVDIVTRLKENRSTIISIVQVSFTEFRRLHFQIRGELEGKLGNCLN
jgi:hypothetical protein